MVLMDPILTECGIAAKIKQSLTDRKVDFFVFDEIVILILAIGIPPQLVWPRHISTKYSKFLCEIYNIMWIFDIIPQLFEFVQGINKKFKFFIFNLFTKVHPHLVERD